MLEKDTEILLNKRKSGIITESYFIEELGKLLKEWGD